MRLGGSFLQVVANVQLNLRDELWDGDERAAQRLGGQYAFQRFHLALIGVDFGVLRRVLRELQRSSHVGGFGCAAADFRAQRVFPCRLVTTLVAIGMQRQWLPQRDFILRPQLVQPDGRHDLD